MRSLLRFPLIVAMVWLCSVGSVVGACDCTAQGRLARRGNCCSATTPSCAPQGCTCPEVVYEEVQQTCYKTVYVEVMEKVTINAVRYVEGTAYRCVPCTVMQPRQPQACGPTATCAPACGQASPTCDMVPVQVLRKVPYTTMQPESYQKVEERPRVVAKQVPYTITVCVPKVVQAPVCGPSPSCCAKPSCSASN